MLKIFEMFSGYGGASFALKKAGIDFECIGYSEIDKYAIECYDKNHFTYVGPIELDSEYGENLKIKSFGDCTKINPNELEDFDLLTGGFPCQSFSVAGKGLGELDTRGTLFNEIIRIAEVKKPKYMLLENVKGLTNKRHKETFEKIVSEIKRIGYYVHIQVLNSKEYGIPQNRERVWFVCFKEKVDFDMFIFPKKEELKIFLKDILEEEVDEKYYISNEKLNKILNSTFNSRRALYQGDKKVCSCLAARDYKEPKIIQLNKNALWPRQRVYDSNGVSPTQTCSTSGSDKIFVRDKEILSHPLKFLNRNQKNLQGKYSGCIDSCNTNGVKIDGTIRKLTPKECFRLMGFLDDGINLEGLSDTQKYKLAGNGWEINLVSKIFNNMLK